MTINPLDEETPNFSNIDINDLISKIDSNSDPTSRYYGKLVKWKFENEWFYGIGLSNEAFFNTINLEVKRRNIANEHGLPILIIKSSRLGFSPLEVIDRLKYILLSIKENKQSNKFDAVTWNDEHLSRFIVNNERFSYKTKVKGDKNKYKNINKFMQTNNPDLYVQFFNSSRNWFFGLLLLTFFLALQYEFYRQVLFGMAIVLFLIYKFTEFEWSGFQDKQLWNWLQLLFVPIILAVGGFALQENAKLLQKESDNEKARQLSLAEYFRNVKDVLNSNSKTEDLSQNQKKLIESFTRIVLSDIDGKQKRQVVKFLYDLGLINKREKTKHKNINLDEADFSKAQLGRLNLSDLYLPNVNLANADFTSTVLDGADFRHSNLKGVIFDLARLPDVSFDKADFRTEEDNDKWQLVQKIDTVNKRSDSNIDLLNSSEVCSFYKTVNRTKSEDYRNKKLSRANLENLDLSHANFDSADLTGASFKNSLLRGANLSNAQLKDVSLEGSNLKDLTIELDSKSNLDRKTKLIINLFKKPMQHIDELQKPEGKDLSSSDLSGIKVINTDLRTQKAIQQINLTNTKLRCSEWENLDMSNSNLTDADLTGAKLTNINLSNSNLQSAILKGTKMIHVNLQGVNLWTADLSDVYIKGDLSYANLNSTTLNSADLREAENLDKADLTGALYNKHTQFPRNFKIPEEMNNSDK